MTDTRISFVTYDERGNVAKAWSPSSEFAWSDAVEEGSDRADELIEHIKSTDDRAMLARVMREAVMSGKSGMLVGFMDRIAERLRYCAAIAFMVLTMIGSEI